MIDDQFRSQLAQFVMHMANMRTWARQNRPLDGSDLASNPEWIAAADQRRILETYLELLCTQSIIGIGNGPDAGEQRLGTDGPPHKLATAASARLRRGEHGPDRNDREALGRLAI